VEGERAGDRESNHSRTDYHYIDDLVHSSGV
jgi:hypothetical protein